jgi:hypothetical protein
MAKHSNLYCLKKTAKNNLNALEMILKLEGENKKIT